MTLEQLQLPEQIHVAMIAHAEFCLPEEACGLMAFDDADALQMVYATTNLDRSKVRFTVAPEEHFGAIRHAESRGWRIAGSFHSHPESAAFPSARDIAGALDPEWLHVVVGLANGMPEVRGFRIRDNGVSEVSLVEIP
ncbi:MAG: M67 family metallopeptidase [bacterium]|nr:M67 family metallopeptidase [bacterium]MCP4965903.1 M67 family metallopeptidase [bacterium]